MNLNNQFNFHSTAYDVIHGVDLTGQRAIVTGGASGIGLETSRALAAAGAEVTIAVRNIKAGEQAVTDIIASTGNKAVRAAFLDLNDRGSITTFANQWTGALHILVNNAGIMALPETRTPEGFEAQFATNYLGHFALALALQPALVLAQGARIVSVSSSAHHFSPIIFDDIHYDIRPYDPWSAYGQSKTATALFAVEATRRWQELGVFANAVMPGAIKTNLQRHSGELPVPEHLWKTPQQGAATSVLVATSPALEGIGGRYYADCDEAAMITRTSGDRMTEFSLVAEWALNKANAERLWNISLELLKR